MLFVGVRNVMDVVFSVSIFLYCDTWSCTCAFKEK